MPFVKRTIEPIKIGSLLTTGSLIQTNNKTRHQSVNNELEQVTVTSLIDVMRQLSCLSLHVQDMFGELQRETTIIFERTMQLNRKVESLRKEIGQLNPIVEEVSLHDINLRKPFKFSTWKDQQIVTHSTRPQCISYVYSTCDPPPLLQLLNTCRSDGKDSLKFYTDPSYFFDLWCQAMQKESKTQMKRHKKHKKTTNATATTPPAVTITTTTTTTSATTSVSTNVNNEKNLQKSKMKDKQQSKDRQVSSTSNSKQNAAAAAASKTSSTAATKSTTTTTITSAATVTTTSSQIKIKTSDSKTADKLKERDKSPDKKSKLKNEKLKSKEDLKSPTTTTTASLSTIITTSVTSSVAGNILTASSTTITTSTSASTTTPATATTSITITTTSMSSSATNASDVAMKLSTKHPTTTTTTSTKSATTTTAPTTATTAAEKPHNVKFKTVNDKSTTTTTVADNDVDILDLSQKSMLSTLVTSSNSIAKSSAAAAASSSDNKLKDQESLYENALALLKQMNEMNEAPAATKLATTSSTVNSTTTTTISTVTISTTNDVKQPAINSSTTLSINLSPNPLNAASTTIKSPKQKQKLKPANLPPAPPTPPELYEAAQFLNQEANNNEVVNVLDNKKLNVADKKDLSGVGDGRKVRVAEILEEVDRRALAMKRDVEGDGRRIVEEESVAAENDQYIRREDADKTNKTVDNNYLLVDDLHEDVLAGESGAIMDVVRDEVDGGGGAVDDDEMSDLPPIPPPPPPTHPCQLAMDTSMASSSLSSSFPSPPASAGLYNHNDDEQVDGDDKTDAGLDDDVLKLQAVDVDATTLLTTLQTTTASTTTTTNNNHLHPKMADEMSLNSEISLLSSGSESSVANVNTDNNGEATNGVLRETRCDLLSAIREGIQLRKVEECRQKIERKARPNVNMRLDVQSIMEVAFEMRRKLLEEDDEEEEEGDDDDNNNNWSDDD